MDLLVMSDATIMTICSLCMYERAISLSYYDNVYSVLLPQNTRASRTLSHVRSTVPSLARRISIRSGASSSNRDHGIGLSKAVGTRPNRTQDQTAKTFMLCWQQTCAFQHFPTLHTDVLETLHAPTAGETADASAIQI